MAKMVGVEGNDREFHEKAAVLLESASPSGDRDVLLDLAKRLRSGELGPKAVAQQIELILSVPSATEHRQPMGWALAVEVDGVMRADGFLYHTRQSAEQDARLPRARGQKAEVWVCYAATEEKRI